MKVAKMNSFKARFGRGVGKGLLGFAVLGGTLALSEKPASGQVEFNFNYTDVNVGFNDAVFGAARRAALESSANIVESVFSNYTATITIDVNGSVTTDGVLASAGSTYSAPFPGIGFGDRGDVGLKILGGNAADPNGAVADGTINWNFQDFSWEYGTDFQVNEFDFVSTAIHEIAHTTGFLSGISQNGTDLWGAAAGTPSTWEAFDEFVGDSAGALIDDATFEIDIARWNAASVGGSGADGLFFYGANAMAENGGNAVNLYSPGPWEAGSSGSHLDDSQYNGQYVMEAAAAPGMGVREFSDLEVAIFRDIGFTNAISAVPEPGSLILLGAMSTVLVSRRRRTS